MAPQTSHISPAASMTIAAALARIAELEAQNERLRNHIEFYEAQPSQMDPGFYVIDMRGEWSGPCRTLSEAQSSVGDYEEGCTVVQVVGQYAATEDTDEYEEAPGYTIAGGYAFRQSLGQASNW